MPAILKGEIMNICTKTIVELDEDEVRALNILRDTHNQCTCRDDLDCSECPFNLGDNKSCMPLLSKLILERG